MVVLHDQFTKGQLSKTTVKQVYFVNCYWGVGGGFITKISRIQPIGVSLQYIVSLQYMLLVKLREFRLIYICCTYETFATQFEVVPVQSASQKVWFCLLTDYQFRYKISICNVSCTNVYKCIAVDPALQKLYIIKECGEKLPFCCNHFDIEEKRFFFH